MALHVSILAMSNSYNLQQFHVLHLMLIHIIQLLFPLYGNIFYEMHFIKMHEGEKEILYLKNVIFKIWSI